MIKCTGDVETHSERTKVRAEETLGASWEATSSLGLLQYNLGGVQGHLILP